MLISFKNKIYLDMQSFALALLATTTFAATSVTIKDVMKATGRIGHVVEGSGTDQKLSL